MSSTGSAAEPEQAVTVPEVDQRQLDRALVKGVAWTGLARWGAQILSWAATILIARLLTKADYGLLSMANLYIGFVQLVNEFGVGAAIVRHRDLSERQIAHLGGISVGVGFVFWALSFLLAFPVAWFFEEPAVRWIIIALGITFVTTALRTLPRALLTRDLKFRTVAMVDSSEAVIAAVATLTLAYLGWSYWSLVVGGILGSLGATLYALRARPHPLAWPSALTDLRQHLTFGTQVVGARVAWYGYSNADFFIVGKVLGTAPLGAYGFGWSLATIPVGRIAGLLGQVTPGIFSAVQHDRPALRRYLLLLSEGVAFFAFPVAAGLALVATDLVNVALGPEWTAAILPLQILAAYGGIRAVASLMPYLLQAVGRSGEAMRFNLLALLVLPPMFLAGTHWGTAGVAFAWVVGYPLVAWPMYRLSLKEAECSFGEYARAHWPALSATLVMIAAVLAWQAYAPADWPGGVRLAGQVLLGGLTYAGLAATFYRARMMAVVETFRRRGPRPSASTPVSR